MEAVDSTGDLARSIQFPESRRAQRSFENIVTVLEQNPQVFRQPLAPGLMEGVQWISRELAADLLRGDDFGTSETSFADRAWIARPENSHLQKYFMEKGKSRAGRLTAIVAMRPDRDELMKIITPETVRDENFLNIASHVSRLLTHTNAPACEDFAMEIVRHPEEFKNIPASSDGTAAAIFYTYGPYVLEEMKRRGFSYLDFMRNWAGKRVTDKDFPGDARYPGIEHMYDRIERKPSKCHYLAQDGNDRTHNFVRLMVKKAIFAPAKLH